MASLSPMPYGSYPAASGSVERAGGRTAANEGPGSFGPVLVVLAVISFLAVGACIAGWLSGRRASSGAGGKAPSASGEKRVAGDAEKGFGAAGVVMRPVASSRATVHDVVDDDNVFEIKFAPGKPAGWEKGGNGGRMQALPPAQLGQPQQNAAAPAAGPRGPAPANGGAAVRLAAHPPARATGPSFSFTPTKQVANLGR